MDRIDELIIENFRGSSSSFTLKLSADKNLTVIFGENGSGKTTIVDALDAVANEKVGSIKDRSSTNAGKHSPTIGKAQKDIAISLTSSGITSSATMKGGRLTSLPPPTTKIRILRKTNLQRFMDAKPADRYLELKYLIAVDNIEKSEQTLSDALNQASAQVDTFARDRASAELIIRGVWEEVGDPSLDPIAWVRAETAIDASEMEHQSLAIANSIRAIETLLRTRERHDAVSRDHRIALEAFQSIERDIANTEGMNANQAIEIANVLREVQTLLGASASTTTCPVCGNAVDGTELRDSVSTRLRQLSRYLELADNRDAAERQFASARNAHAQCEVEFVREAREITRISVGEPSTYEPFDLRGLVEGKPSDDEDRDTLVHFAVQISAMADSCVGMLAELKQSTDKALGSLTPLEQTLKSFDDATDQAAEAHIRKERLDRVLAIVREQRHAFSRLLLEDVRDECNRLYGAIHPNEGLAIARLELDPKQRASLYQSVTFEGHDDVPPQAYLSEAHMDTLGFCFWLAVAKRDAQETPLVIVIDDVFSSADAQHLGRIIDLIADQCAHFTQVILTTHHRTVMETFRNSYGPGKLAELLTLESGWNVERGIVMSNSPLAVDELRTELKAIPFDRQAAASKAGILLEAALDKLALQYRCRVPRKAENTYDLNELLDGTTTLMKKLETKRADVTSKPLPREIVQKIRQLKVVRNSVGAHFNPSGYDIADSDIREFASRAIDIVEAVTCPTCGRIPHRADDSRYRCSCPDKTLTTMTPRTLD